MLHGAFPPLPPNTFNGVVPVYIKFEVRFVENIKMVTVQVFSVTFINVFCLYFVDPTDRATVIRCYQPLGPEGDKNFALI
jgi:hypothetical protein